MKNIEIEIRKYLDERGWDKLRPSDLAKSTQIIKDKLEHIKNKFPAELMRKNAKKDSGSGTDPLYLEIKKKYREK